MKTINTSLQRFFKKQKNIHYKIGLANLLIESFLLSSSDTRRLIRSEAATNSILGFNDLEDLIEVRKKIREMELLVNTKYNNQKDHTCHTLYVYLLGIFLGVKCRTLKSDFSRISRPKKVTFFSSDEGTLMWTYASLLHDIGYLFTEGNKQGLFFLESMFGADHVLRLIKESRPKNFYPSKIDGEFQKFSDFIKSIIDPKFVPHYIDKPPLDLIKELRRLVWITDLGFNKNDLFEIFSEENIYSNLKDNGKLDHFEKFIKTIAQEGYTKTDGPKVDHAFASAAFLFQYASFWYWLAFKTKEINEQWYDDYFCTTQRGFFNYEFDNLKKIILPGVFACAFHNIGPFNDFGKLCIPIPLKDNPLVYLSILADILQIWDRFPAGTNNITNLEDFNKKNFCSSDINIELIKPTGKVKFIFNLALTDYYPDTNYLNYSINEESLKTDIQKIIDDLMCTLKERLERIEDLIEFDFIIINRIREIEEQRIEKDYNEITKLLSSKSKNNNKC